MRKKEIDAWLAELVRALGPARPSVPKDEFARLHAAKDYKGMLRLVRKHMRLGLRLIFEYQENLGSHPMVVGIPQRMPLYNTEEYRRLSITIAVSKEKLGRTPCGTVVVMMAHELAHVTLAALRNPLGKVEPAVDLAAMLLGFKDYFLLHSEFVTATETATERPRSFWKRLRRLLDGGANDVSTVEIGYLTAQERGYAHACLKSNFG